MTADNFPRKQAAWQHTPPDGLDGFAGSSWWTFQIFLIFFCSGEGKGESEAPVGGGGAIFLLKIPGGGGSLGRVGAAGGLGGCLWGIWGEGLNIF